MAELPYEILSQIAVNLSTTDKCSCALTCKAWRYPFQEALWRNIQIDTCQRAKELIEMIKTSQNVSTLHCLWVHSLRTPNFSYPLEVPEIHFFGLFKHLPNLKRLDLGSNDYRNVYTEITRSDAVWKSLESLKIHLRATKDKQSAKDLFEFINTCSMLQKLEIHRVEQGFHTEFSVVDFDKMHQNLQKLSSIDAEIYLNIDFSSILDTIPNTTPAFAVTTLDIYSIAYECHSIYYNRDWNKWNPLWLYYFGYKYPNLRSLKLNATQVRTDNMNSGQKLAMISLFQSNPNAFRHLETFNFTIDEYFVFGDFVLWELFYALKVPLKHLELDGTHCDEVDRSYPIDIDRILRSFSETLESLSLTGFIYSDNDENSILELSSYYPVLTNICINSDGSSLNLGNLLDRCVALKQLKFGAGYLSIDPETTTEESAQQKQEQHYQHGLQILILHECAVTTELLNYFSFRCRSLEYMTLDNVFIEGSICEKTGCMLLDMTHTSLKTLNIGLLQYGTSDEVTGPNHTIDLTLVSQLSDEKNETEKKEMDSKWPIIGINHIGWFHTYSIWNYCGRAYIYTMKLTEKGSNTPLEYYQNLRSNRISQTVKDASLCNENISKMERYCRLDYGYAELRFKKIKTALVKYEKEYFDCGNNVDLLINDLLDNCPAPKRVGFSGRTLRIKPSPTTEDLKLQQHGLQILSLYRCTTFAKVLNYISLRCERLRDMTLDNLCVLGFRCKNPGDLLIGMPYTFLNTLGIGIVEYSTSSKQTGRDYAVSLILLPQLNDPRLSDEKNERKKTEIDLRSPLLAIHHIYWLYTYEYEPVVWRAGQETIVLSEEKVDVILKYDQSFQSNTASLTFKDDSSYSGYERENNWTHGLYNGYGELRFGNIKAVPVIFLPEDIE